MSRSEVTITVNVRPARAYVDNMLENMRSYRKPLLEGTAFLKTKFAENFDSSGALVGGWDPLKPSTAAWRAENGFPPVAPILVNTGSLRAAVYGARVDVGDREASVTVQHRLAEFHQYGSRKVNLPKREIVFVPAEFGDLMAERIVGHIMPNALTAKLRNLFQR